MASLTIQVERWNDTDWAFVRVRNGDAPEADKDVLRLIKHDIFDETPLPAEHRSRAGALVHLLFGFTDRTVLQVEIRGVDDGDLWVAEAVLDDNDETVLRRGTAANPVDALVDLSFDVVFY